MIAAQPDWLAARRPFDDAARAQSLPLVEKAAEAVGGCTGRPLLLIDIGAGTGHSMAWFSTRLGKQLGEREIHRVLVDGNAAALGIASAKLGSSLRTVTAPISSLPEIVAELLAAEPKPCDLLVTASALLDVLTTTDAEAIMETLRRFGGVGLFLLSISGHWQITPQHRDDEALDVAFGRHQRRENRLGTSGAHVLCDHARATGAHVYSDQSFWQLETPEDAPFMARFLTERAEAAVEEDPLLEARAQRWLEERLATLHGDGLGGADSSTAHGGAGLRVVIEHTDLVIDATAADAGSSSQTTDRHQT